MVRARTAEALPGFGRRPPPSRCPLPMFTPALTRFDPASLAIPHWLVSGGQQAHANARSALPQAGQSWVLERLGLSEASARAVRIALLALAGFGLVVAESLLLSAHGAPGLTSALFAVLVASAISSVTGFAFSALCGAMLLHLLDSPVFAIQVMIVCNIASKLLSVATLWRSIHWPSLPVFLVGGLLGVPAGVYLLLHLQTEAYQAAIGIVLVAYGSYLLLRRPSLSLRTGPLSDMWVGFLGGLTAWLAGGVFVAMWCGIKGWDKARQRGVYQPFILAMQPITLIVLFAMRQQAPLQPAPSDWLTLAFIPPALLGARLGLHVFARLTERQFEIAANALLIVSGVGLIV